MSNLENLITTCIELGASRAMETLGLTAGEISQRKAIQVYGKWFADAQRAGRIHPSRIEDGARGTRIYRVVDILALKTRDLAQAELR